MFQSRNAEPIENGGVSRLDYLIYPATIAMIMAVFGTTVIRNSFTLQSRNHGVR